MMGLAASHATSRIAVAAVQMMSQSSPRYSTTMRVKRAALQASRARCGLGLLHTLRVGRMCYARSPGGGSPQASGLGLPSWARAVRREEVRQDEASRTGEGTLASKYGEGGCLTFLHIPRKGCCLFLLPRGQGRGETWRSGGRAGVGWALQCGPQAVAATTYLPVDAEEPHLDRVHRGSSEGMVSLHSVLVAVLYEDQGAAVGQGEDHKR
jgi:hypothetical protein